MIEGYVREFERCLVGTSAQKAEWRAELLAHLQGAKDAGDLDGTLARLGSPREAAAAFRSGPALESAAPVRRWLAQAVDHIPLFAVAVVSAITAYDGHKFAFGFPPPLAVSNTYTLFHNLAIPLAILWSWVGLALIEARGGRTPGKALFGLRTVSSDGTTLTRTQAIKRRFSILLGLLAWIDWAATFFTARNQRLLDLFAHTMVVEDPSVLDNSRAPGNRSSLRS